MSDFSVEIWLFEKYYFTRIFPFKHVFSKYTTTNSFIQIRLIYYYLEKTVEMITFILSEKEFSKHINIKEGNYLPCSKLYSV